MGFAADNPLSMSELLDRIGGEAACHGATVETVAGVAPLHLAEAGFLTFYSGGPEGAAERLAGLPHGAAVLLGKNIDVSTLSHVCSISVLHPRYSFIRATRALFPRPRLSFSGVSDRALVSQNARIGMDVVVSPFAVVEDDAEIGDGSVLFPGVHIGRGCRLGQRVTVLSNSSIGCPGQASERNESGMHTTLPHLAAVVIGDETTIGANSVIVQGSLTDTTVGRRCAIGNQVNIGHNATVEDDCFVSAGSILAGSVHLEPGVWIAPGVTVLNKIRIGREAVIALGSVVTKPLAGGGFYAGIPAREVRRTAANTYNDKRAE